MRKSESVGEPPRESRNILALFLLQAEKVRMRTDFKNVLNFKSNPEFKAGF
jgi:hypothetical protein